MIPDILGWERAVPWLMLALFGGYFAGSIPMGLLVSRLFGLADPRGVGSGNIGATNVLRAGGRGAAALTLLLDLGKGLVPVLLAGSWGPLAAAAAGAGAVIGHCMPVWLGFRGGKGVATALGAALAWHWPAALAGLLVWLLAVVATRYVSLGSILGALTVVAVLAWSEQWDLMPAAAPVALLVVARHAANIRRLVTGKESRISLGRKPPA